MLQAMEKHRENRFASATAFLQALEDSEASKVSAAAGDGGDGADPGDATCRCRTDAARAPRCRSCSSLLVRSVVGGAGRRRRARAITALRADGHVRREPAPPPPALAAELKKVEALLEDGQHARRPAGAGGELASRPKDARVHYMLGRVAFARTTATRRLSSYAAGDHARSRLPRRSGAARPRRHRARRAEAGRGGARPDHRQDRRAGGRSAGKGGERGERSGAPPAGGRRAGRDGEGERVDRVVARLLELRKAPTCEERRTGSSSCASPATRARCRRCAALRARTDGPPDAAGEGRARPA